MFKSLKNPNILWYGIALFLIFFGYGSAEQHFSVFYNQMGKANIALQALAILYGAVVIGNIIAPVLAEKAGLKRSFLIAFLTYTALVFAITRGNTWLVYGFSALLGIGAALAGVAGNDFIRLTVQAKERGEAAGTTGSLRTLGAFLGISGMSFILRALSINKAFITLGAIMLVGVATLVLLQEPVQEEKKEKAKIKTSLHWDHKVALLLPLFVVPGIILGLILGAIPMIVEETHGIGNVGWVMSIFHLTLAVILFSAGKLSDIKGRTQVLYAATLSVLAGIVILLMTANLFGLVLAMVLIGIFSAATGSVSPALVMDVFGEKTKEATATLGIAGVLFGVVPTLLLKNYFSQNVLFAIAGATALLIIVTLRTFEKRYLKREE